jgi:hypothetical protein
LLKYLVGIGYSNENHYPSSDSDIVADNNSQSAQVKQAYLAVLLRPQICTKGKGYT